MRRRTLTLSLALGALAAATVAPRLVRGDAPPSAAVAESVPEVVEAVVPEAVVPEAVVTEAVVTEAVVTEAVVTEVVEGAIREPHKAVKPVAQPPADRDARVHVPDRLIPELDVPLSPTPAVPESFWDGCPTCGMG